MNKIYKILLYLVLLIQGIQTFAMDWAKDIIKEKGPEIAEGIGKAASGFARDIKLMRDQRARDKQRERKKLEDNMNNAQSEQERLFWAQELAKFDEAERKADERWDQTASNVTNLVPEGYKVLFGALQEEQKAQHEKEKEAIRAELNRRAQVENAKSYIKSIQNKKTVLGLTGIAVGVFGAWHGTKFAGKYLDQRLKNPTLAQETSLVGWKDTISNYIFGSEQPRKEVSDVILEPKLAARILELTTSIANTVKNNSYFQNILFYGPPGTGKTMVSKRIARSTGLEYIYFAASSLDQYSIDDALIKLTELFEFAKNSSKKLMLIIDEAEILFSDRAKIQSEKTQKMLNLILTYTGTESKNFLLVALTNRPEVLDSAFLSRCDEQIEIGPPSHEQRLAILKMYVDEYLVKASNVSQEVSYWQWLWGYQPPTKLKIEEDTLSEEKLKEIADKLNNFVGRDISKMVIAIQQAAFASKDATVTTEIIDRIVNLKIEQKKKELENHRIHIVE